MPGSSQSRLRFEREDGRKKRAQRLCRLGGRRFHVGTGGKSELRRAGCWVTPSGGNSKDSATESKPPAASAGKGETVR